MALVMESATTKDISLAERFIRPPQGTTLPVPNEYRPSLYPIIDRWSCVVDASSDKFHPLHGRLAISENDGDPDFPHGARLSSASAASNCAAAVNLARARYAVRGLWAGVEQVVAATVPFFVACGGLDNVEPHYSPLAGIWFQTAIAVTMSRAPTYDLRPQ
jgi:hypothetical protein